MVSKIALLFNCSFILLIFKLSTVNKICLSVYQFKNLSIYPSASGLLFTDISDHLPIFTILSDHCNNTSRNIYVTFREKIVNNMAAF